MRRCGTAFAVCLWFMVAGWIRAGTTWVADHHLVRWEGGRLACTFDAADGSLLSIGEKEATGTRVQSGEDGLWRLLFDDGTRCAAASFSRRNSSFRFNHEIEGRQLTLTYAAGDLTVTVTVTPRDDAIDITGEIADPPKIVHTFECPALVRFSTTDLARVVMPAHAEESVGVALLPPFFYLRPESWPARWEREACDERSWTMLFGRHLPPPGGAETEKPVPVHVTEDGRTWLGADVAAKLGTWRAVVSVPSEKSQYDVSLLDSERGPFVCGSHLGGTGWLFRAGGPIRPHDADWYRLVVKRIVTHGLNTSPVKRSTIALIDCPKPPSPAACGAPSCAAVTVAQWESDFKQLAASHEAIAAVVSITTPSELLAALRGETHAVIVNPYGEWFPVPRGTPSSIVISALKRFVRGGGMWIECGGRPFRIAVRPLPALPYTVDYPTAFADFAQIEAAGGTLAIYRVQPKTWKPWAGQEDPAAILVPARLSCGGDAHGGFYSRGLATYVPPGTTWRAPPVRLRAGGSVYDNLKAYSVANDLGRSLAEKLKARDAATYPRALFLQVDDGGCVGKRAVAEHFFSPLVIHFADYLKGGIDGEYPDHLPVNPAFGTSQQVRALLDSAAKKGHFVSLHTNVTWWRDNPAGPTFTRAGKRALVVGTDGKRAYEPRLDTSGWTACPWHDAVRKATTSATEGLVQEFPSAILFRAECGARRWRYDFNSAAPVPFAYTEGILSLMQDDAQTALLATAGGWDRIIDQVIALQGLGEGLMRTGGSACTASLLRTLPPRTWEIFPLAQALAHGRVVMTARPSGSAEPDRIRLAWALGLGYGLSRRATCKELASSGISEWISWLARLQAEVCARHIGEPLKSFAHVRDADGGEVLRAAYGDVEITANVGTRPHKLQDGSVLSPAGFLVKGPNLLAGAVSALRGRSFPDAEMLFVATTRETTQEAWIHAPAGTELALPRGDAAARSAVIRFESLDPAPARIDGEFVLFTTPGTRAASGVPVPDALRFRAPSDRTPPPTKIGVVYLEGTVKPLRTRISCDRWMAALSDSSLVTTRKVQVIKLTSVVELTAALTTGATEWFAILNPYGEIIPQETGGTWEAMLEAIARYVKDGGIWWETGGTPFQWGVSRMPSGSWSSAFIGPAGIQTLGLTVKKTAGKPEAEAVTVTAQGRAILGEDLAATIEHQPWLVDRTPADTLLPSTALVTGASGDYVTGYRLGGWGWLWRIGGSYPDEKLTPRLVGSVLDYLYTHAPSQYVGDAATAKTWHAVIETSPK